MNAVADSMSKKESHRNGLSRLDAVGNLQLAHECDDLLHRSLAHLRLRRHVAEVPVVLRNTALGSKYESGVGVVARFIDLVDERWTLIGAASKGTVTDCLLYTSPSPRDGLLSRMPSSA